MNKIYYAGIGSRRTPPDILDKMKVIGYVLATEGFVLRSGAAEGADSAFEKGCDLAKGEKEIYLPWQSFNKSKSQRYPSSDKAFLIAERYHPAWRKLTQTARDLHARNSHQILGSDMNTPSSFVVCYSPGTGGTEQAIRIAESLKIPVYNLYNLSTDAAFGMTLLEIFCSIYRKVKCQT